MSDAIIKHALQIDLDVHPDTGDPTKLGPASWNAPLVLSGGNDGEVLVRRTSGTATGGEWEALPAADVSQAELDAAVTAANAYADTGDATTLASANTHSDSGITSLFTGAATGSIGTKAAGSAFVWLDDVAAGSVLVSGGVGVVPAWSASPTLTNLTLTGIGKIADGSAAAPSLAFSGAATTGFFRPSGTVIGFAANGIARFAMANSDFRVRSDGFISFASTTDPTSSPDVILRRDASNALALRNSTASQSLRAYASYTDDSNYTRGSLNASTTAVTLAAESAGTGSANVDLALTPKGTGAVRFGTHAAIGAEAITGYITIKDAGGTTRKLAVVS